MIWKIGSSLPMENIGKFSWMCATWEVTLIFHLRGSGFPLSGRVVKALQGIEASPISRASATAPACYNRRQKGDGGTYVEAPIEIRRMHLRTTAWVFGPSMKAKASGRLDVHTHGQAGERLLQQRPKVTEASEGHTWSMRFRTAPALTKTFHTCNRPDSLWFIHVRKFTAVHNRFRIVSQ